MFPNFKLVNFVYENRNLNKIINKFYYAYVNMCNFRINTLMNKLKLKLVHDSKLVMV
jgi:hypothetical protein